MNWMYFALFSGVFWAIADGIMRPFSQKVELFHGPFLLISGMFVTILVIGIFAGKLHSQMFTTTENSAILWFLVAGVINALGYFFFIKFFQSGGNLAQGLPFITTVIMLGSVLIGIVFFKDPLNWRIGSGIVLALGALYLLR